MIYLPQVGCFSILSGSLLCCCLYCPMLATCMRNQQLTNTQLRVISTTLQASWKKHADILQHTLWHISWHIFGQFRCLHLDKILTEQLWQFCWYLYLNLNCNKFADTLMVQYLTIRDILSFSDRSIFCDSYSDDIYIYIIYIYICSKKKNKSEMYSDMCYSANPADGRGTSTHCLRQHHPSRESPKLYLVIWCFPWGAEWTGYVSEWVVALEEKALENAWRWSTYIYSHGIFVNIYLHCNCHDWCPGFL